MVREAGGKTSDGDNGSTTATLGDSANPELKGFVAVHNARFQHGPVMQFAGIVMERGWAHKPPTSTRR